MKLPVGHQRMIEAVVSANPHTLNLKKPKTLRYQGFWLFLFSLFRIMFRRIEAFLKFPKTNRNQVKLFFFVNPCSLTFALGAEG